MSVADGRVGWSIAEGKFRRKFIIHVVYRIYTGILISVLIGTCVGLLVKRTWGRLTKP